MLAQGAGDEKHLRLIRSLGLRSYICVPLVVSGYPLGVLTFATAESGRTYTDADLALAVDLAQRAGVAIENTQLYQALRDADRRKDEFLATLAHEHRKPLASIRNGLHVISLTGAGGTVEQARSMMERQLTQMVRLVDDLLDVSRISRGKIDLRKERVEVRAVIDLRKERVEVRAVIDLRRGNRRPADRAGRARTRGVPAGRAGVRARGRGPGVPGGVEPAHQQCQVHSPGRAHLTGCRVRRR